MFRALNSHRVSLAPGPGLTYFGAPANKGVSFCLRHSDFFPLLLESVKEISIGGNSVSIKIASSACPKISVILSGF
jgi:hypothetical protein